ncbi:MAG: hypothetical protein ACLQVD_10080 [Capsulimonadaceae bacterium]
MQSASFTCSRCGAPLPAGVVQCTNCGLPFAQPVPAPLPPGYGVPPPPAKKGLGPFAIIGIVAAVGCLPVAAIVAAILFPVFAQARERAVELSSLTNLKQIGLATMEYEAANNNQLPPTDTYDHFRSAVGAYLPKDAQHDFFTEPGPNVPYLVNAAISGKSATSINNPAGVVVAREGQPHSDGRIGILYADGHVTMLPQTPIGSQ